MGTITHIELTSASPEATTRFYAEAFGWETTASPFVPDYHVADTGTGGGIDAAIMSSSYQSQNTIMWIEVSDLDATIAAVEQAGGARAGDFHDLPGVGRVGYVTDPAGVVIGLKQPA
ncbi:MAG: VOC family protein [Dietzia sp.]